MEQQIKKIIKQQQEIFDRLERVERHIKIARIFTIFKILMIIIPLILAAIYLPPYIEEIVSEYLEILQIMK